MVFQKYTSLWIDPTDVSVSAAYLGMDPILTDFQTGSNKKVENGKKTHAICLLLVG